MIKRIATTALVVALALPAALSAQQRMVVRADMGQDTINRHIYGHFAEHLGRMIYDGVWVQNANGEWGYRDDVIQALKGIQIPNLRWPGGCFADYYHWRDGVGALDQRPSMVNLSWGATEEDNSFGTHEFMELVRRLETEPFIVANVGTGSAAETRDWWEYLNRPIGPMAQLRAANGHPEPFNVRYFQIGNENWGCGGRMTPEFYADLYKQHETFVRNIGPLRPFRIATGPNAADYNWTEGVMREAGNRIDGLDFHYYTRVRTFGPGGGPPVAAAGGAPQQAQGRVLSRSATDFGEAEWFMGMRNAYRMDELIRGHSAIMDRYDPNKRVWLIVGEWGMWHEVEPGTNPGFLYQQNTLRDAVVAGLHLNIFNNHADRVKMGNLAQTVNVLQSVVLTEPNGGRMILTPTYHVFEMFNPHHDALLLPIELDEGTYTFEGETMPAVSASASQKDGRITITLVNMDHRQARTVQTEVQGARVSGVSGRVLTHNALNAHNTFDRPNEVRPAAFNGARLSGNNLRVELPAKSVVVLELR
jgi:alpha-L-arabinofuranosidase